MRMAEVLSDWVGYMALSQQSGGGRQVVCMLQRREGEWAITAMARFAGWVVMGLVWAGLAGTAAGILALAVQMVWRDAQRINPDSPVLAAGNAALAYIGITGSALTN